MYFVEIAVERHKFNTGPSVTMADITWDKEFLPDVYFADSKIKFTVYARRQYTAKKMKDLQREGKFEGKECDQVIGVSELPLHQLRGKTNYHIWVMLEPPEVNTSIMSIHCCRDVTNACSCLPAPY